MMNTQTTLFQQFLDNYQAKQFQAAIDIASKLEHTIRETGEENAIQFFNTLGYCYLNLKNYSKAAACFNVLIKEHPANYLGVDGLIAITIEQGNWEQVLKFATIFQRYYPTMWQGLYYEAISYKNLGNAKKEKAAYTKMEKKFPEKFAELTAQAALAQSKELEKMILPERDKKNWQRVIELSAEFQQKFPNMWQGFWWQGDAYRQLKQTDLAKQQFDYLLQHFPDVHYGWEGHMNLAEEKQDWQKVAELLIEIKPKFPNLWQGFWWQGNHHKRQKEWNLALAEFAELQNKFPSVYQGFAGEITVEQARQNWGRVVELSTEFQQKFPNMWQGFWWQGQAYRQLKQIDLAKQQFSYLQQHFSHLHYGLEGEIQVEQANQNWERVVELSTEFQQKFPNMWQGFWWQGQAYRQLKQADLAAQSFDYLQQNFPNLHYGLEGHMNLAEDKQDWQKVAELLLEVKPKFPNLWQSFWWQGNHHKRQQEWDLALAEFKESQNKFPSVYQGFAGEITVEQARQNWGRVVELSVAFQQKFPHMWQGLWWLGEALQNLERFEEAKPAFALLAEKFPNDYNRLKSKIKVN